MAADRNLGPTAPGERVRRPDEKRFTDSGIEIKAVYTAADLAGWDPVAKLGAPGQFPYTRGVHADMYRGRLWTMRQYAGFGTAESTNERFKFLLGAGPDRALVRLRPAHPDGLRLGPPPGRGRGGQGGGGHRLAGRHAGSCWPAFPSTRSPPR